jgi:tetratricopeptide (TPR) repeat protein
VLLGGGVDGDGNIRGFAVNVAARMEQSAPAGTLRISHDTYRHIRGVFDVTQQVPIQVKGVVEPMLTYLVQRCKPRAFRVVSRGVEGVETHMIGRDAELAQLQQAYQRLHEQGRLSIITVVAEAGLGKSRLLYEFQNWAETRPERFILFRGRARPTTQCQLFGLLRDMLAWRLQIVDGDSLAVARQKFEQGITPMFVTASGADMAQEHAHLLGHLIGIDFSASPHIRGIQDDSQQLRDRGFHAAALLLRLIAAQNNKPILVLLDDLQWADDGSLDFLRYFLQVNCDVPILLLGLTRPTLFERRPHWPGTDAAELIELRSLNPSASCLLANELLKKLPEIPAALRELITSGAEGNPFYMEELLKMLVDEGAIVTGTESWHLNRAQLLATRVPQSLTGVLQARLDGLQPAEKLALQQAAVIGFVFWDQALAAIDARSCAALPGATRRELVIQHQETGLDGVREFVFQHQLLHQVIYETVLKPTRRACHAAVALWLSGLSSARAHDFLVVIAEHFERAGDSAQAAEYFTRAAEYAVARHAHEAALDYVAKALALTEAPTSRSTGKSSIEPDQRLLRWRLFDMRERTFDFLGMRSEQQAELATLQALADALGDDRRRCEVAQRRSTLAMRTGDYAVMENAARAAMALAERAGDAILALRGQHRLALAMTYSGATAQGRTLAREGVVRARQLGMRQLEALFLNALSVIADLQVDRLVSLEMDEQDLLINRELGNRRGEAIALVNLGSGWLRLGADSQATRYLEDGLRVARAVGDRLTQANTLANLSALALRRGDAALALAHAQMALDIASAVQSPEFEAIALYSLGNAELALGRQATALAAFERSRLVALAIGSATQHDASAGLARVALSQGDEATAMQAVAGLLEQIDGAGALEGTEAPYLIRLTCYQVHERFGAARAKALLQSAHTGLQALAAKLTETTLHKNFLDNIPEHRAIVTAWAEQGSSLTMKQ